MMFAVENDCSSMVWFGKRISCLSQKSRFLSGAGEVFRAGARDEDRGEPSRVSVATRPKMIFREDFTHIGVLVAKLLDRNVTKLS